MAMLVYRSVGLHIAFSFFWPFMLVSSVLGILMASIGPVVWIFGIPENERDSY